MASKAINSIEIKPGEWSVLKEGKIYDFLSNCGQIFEANLISQCKIVPVKYKKPNLWIPYPLYIIKVKFFCKLAFPSLFVVYRGKRENEVFMVYIAFKMLK